jgi:hypothetical protein
VVTGAIRKHTRRAATANRAFSARMPAVSRRPAGQSPAVWKPVRYS